MTDDARTHRDLVVLTADSQAQAAISTLLEQRRRSLQIREVSWDIYNHPNKDPGCLNESHDFLRSFTNDYQHALVIFDYEGCGRTNEEPGALAGRVEQKLEHNGWEEERARCVVLDPELEVWVWSDSPEVAHALGWDDTRLRKWLESAGLWNPDDSKPDDPKRAMEAALEKIREPRSSSIYSKIAETVGLGRCEDPSFNRFSEILRNWFGTDQNYRPSPE